MALYLVNRYMGNIMLIFVVSVALDGDVNDRFCYIFFRAQAWTTAILVWSTQTIMQKRLFALYNRSRNVVISISICFFVEVAAVSLFLVFDFLHMGATTVRVLGMVTCAPVNDPPYLASYWILMAVFEAILCSLAVLVGIKFIRLHGPWKMHLLLTVMLRDSIAYFIILLSAYVTCAIIWFVTPALRGNSSWIEVPAGFTAMLTNIVGARLILNLRGVYYRPFAEEMSHAGGNALWSLQHIPTTRASASDGPLRDDAALVATDVVTMSSTSSQSDARAPTRQHHHLPTIS